VVVNDLGGSMEGEGADTGPASKATAGIVAAGGTAVADTSDVATTEGANALIQHAVAQFGRVDILVNNAGIIRWAGFPDADADNLAKHLAVHVGGSFNTARAAWSLMVDRGYGRIVMTTSSGMFGLPNNLSYATAKAAVVGMTRSLATAGASHGIKVNLIAPGALTRMAGQPAADAAPPTAVTDAAQMSPDLVAPLVAFLAHESCPVTGEMYAAGFGRFARMFVASSPGWAQVASAPTVEDVAEHWAAINDETGYVVPADLTAWSAAFMSHLHPGATGGGQ
jgi:NAD(P)-dependent dehydrogenase (short-subunit alcohol dehydrogenase family)